MSFLERARAKAEQAAGQALKAAEHVREAASEEARAAQATMADPATAERVRQSLRRAKKGVATALDRIDPGVLADIIIKATALQERTNTSLRAKGSAYRVAEVMIGASFPPSINFVIARIHELAETADGRDVSSMELAGDLPASDGTIQALDGSTIDEADLLDDDLGQSVQVSAGVPRGA